MTGSASESDGGHNAGRAIIRSGKHSHIEELRKEFLLVLKTVESSEEGDLSRRGRTAYKGIVVLQKLLKAVDDLVVEEYQRGEPSLWRLNCLVYSGAELVSRRTWQTFVATMKKQPSQKQKKAMVTHL